VTQVSQRMQEATGIDPETLVGRRIDELTDSRLPLRTLLDPEGDRESFRDIELALENDGRVQHVRVSGSPIITPEGDFAGFRGSGTDITSEVNAKQDAESAKTRLYDALESIQEGFVLTDAQDRVVYVNSRVNEIFGDDGALFHTGEPLEEVLFELAKKATYTALDADPLDAAKWRLEIHRKAPCDIEFMNAGGERWLRATERRTTEGGWVITWTDITALKDREEQLRQSEERFRLATTGADAGIWDYSVETGLVHASPHMKEMGGFTGDKEPIHIEQWRRQIHPEDLAEHDDALRAHLRGDKPFFRIEHRLAAIAGSPRGASVCVTRTVASSASPARPRMSASARKRRRNGKRWSIN